MTDGITRTLRTNATLRSPNWDSYGAPAVTDAAMNAADELYRRFRAVPMADGGIQLEVMSNGWVIEIEIGADGQPQAALIGRSGDDIMTTYAEWPKEAIVERAAASA